MELDHAIIEKLRVTPGRAAGLAGRDTAGVPGEGKQRDILRRAAADEDLRDFSSGMDAAQELLYASRAYAVLVVFQGLDAAGKDGTIKHVMSGLNPQGCEVTSFKQPSAEELDHDFLWRVGRALPRRGHIGIFNRSYYEDVLVARVHPNLLGPAGAGPDTDKLWEERFDDINAFERHLHRNDTRIVKFFLNVSKQEQKRRLLERLEDPSKYWKFSSSDLAERQHWDAYQAAYEDALSATSTAWAPWYVVPADHKHVMRALVAGVLTHTIERLHLSTPKVSSAQVKEIEAARDQLRGSE